MEFDKNRVYTALTADVIKPGSKGYYADCIADLEERVHFDNKNHYGEVMLINPTAFTYRFKLTKVAGSDFALFYLVEEPGEEKEFRPFRDTDEMVKDFQGRYNLSAKDYSLPFIYIKNKHTEERSMIISFKKQLVIIPEKCLSLNYLFDNYEYLDGTPCGIKDETPCGIKDEEV